MPQFTLLEPPPEPPPSPAKLELTEDDPIPSSPPHRANPSTAHAARPPTSGSGGGGGDGDDFGAWATNARPPPTPRTTPYRPVPHTEPTPRPHTPPVHLRVAVVVVAAMATTSVRGRQTPSRRVRYSE
jgi:hypothetical protein